MIQLDDLKICDNCGNAFAKQLGDKAMNRCPACKTWRMENKTKN
ncbi:MAG: DNA repair protein RadA [Nitrosopumilus sp.]|nr:DNA repair protein RadA [Nitrosopumilus sp.]MDH3384873.1 DNA repair protein RadA [Nitrosopumilus sp.]